MPYHRLDWEHSACGGGVNLWMSSATQCAAAGDAPSARVVHQTARDPQRGEPASDIPTSALAGRHKRVRLLDEMLVTEFWHRLAERFGQPLGREGAVASGCSR
jgi:hypothetical protein